MIRIIPLWSLVSFALAACQTAQPAQQTARLLDGELIQSTGQTPPKGPRGSCWGKDTTPAIVETVTEQILLRPAQIAPDGRVIQPASYRTETRQAIIRERRDVWFLSPCPPEMDVEFVESLQRALKARGVYRGAITGNYDARTRNAVRKFQAPQGLDSGVLSLAAARQLGLVAYLKRTSGS